MTCVGRNAAFSVRGHAPTCAWSVLCKFRVSGSKELLTGVARVVEVQLAALRDAAELREVAARRGTRFWSCTGGGAAQQAHGLLMPSVSLSTMIARVSLSTALRPA